MKHPWLAWYPGDYISKTRGLTMAEHGAYLLLLWEYYVTGPIPANAQHVLNVCLAHNEQEQAATQRVLGLFFVEKDGMYRHKRADEEIKKRELIRKERVKAGKARQQKASKCSANAQQMPTQSQPQSQLQEKRGSTPVQEYTQEDFDDRDCRRYAASKKKVEQFLAARAGSNFTMTDAEYYEWIADDSGLPIKRILEVKTMLKWPIGVAQ